jgi:hypothetical protein
LAAAVTKTVTDASPPHAPRASALNWLMPVAAAMAIERLDGASHRARGPSEPPDHRPRTKKKGHHASA